MSLLAVRLEAIILSGESRAGVSLIGQTFPSQPSVPASWDRVEYRDFMSSHFRWTMTLCFYLFSYLYCFICMPVSCVWDSTCACVCTLMPGKDVGFLSSSHSTLVTCSRVSHLTWNLPFWLAWLAKRDPWSQPLFLLLLPQAQGYRPTSPCLEFT